MESVFETVVIDPGLPTELLPKDWPQRGLHEAMARFYPAIGRPAFERLRELLPEIAIAEPADVARSRALREASSSPARLPAASAS